MIKLIKNIYNQLNLELKILFIALLSGLIFSVCTALINFFLDLGNILVIMSLICGVIALISLYFVCIKKNSIIPSYLTLFFLILAVYPVLWINNGGSKGPIFLFMITNSVFFAVLYNRINVRLLATLEIIIAGILLFVEYRYPDIIKPYLSAKARAIDMMFSFFIVFMISMLVMSRIMKEYMKAIKNLKAANERLRFVSETDELTGIYNRRYIFGELESRINTGITPGQFSLLMLDIDYFKKINDSYGHNAGDEVLKRISHVLRENIRKTDILGRIGGEEFLVLMPGISERDAFERAENLRMKIESLEWPHKDLRVTVSGGVFCSGKNDTIDYLLEQADLRLYKSKNRGRNRITA